MLLNYCMYAFVMMSPVTSFSHGAPDFSCKDPSTFHTKRINETHEGIIMPQDMLTNPYTANIDVIKYTPGQKVTVKLQAGDPRKSFRGFFLQAVQAGIHLRDLRRRPFGRFENTTSDEHPSVCQSFGTTETTGITHSNNKEKQTVTVTWVAPFEYNPGEIQFLATIVLDYSTYWTDIRSKILSPEGYDVKSENTFNERYTPTAAWFRWLQYIRQMQLLKKNLGLPIKASQDIKGVGHDHTGPDHGHHHHHHHHHHDPAYDSTTGKPLNTSSSSTETQTV